MAEIHLSEQDQKFVDEQVETGAYRSADEVIHASLSLLNSEEGQLVELRKIINDADEQFERGEFLTFSTDDDLTDYIIERARNEKR